MKYLLLVGLLFVGISTVAFGDASTTCNAGNQGARCEQKCHPGSVGRGFRNFCIFALP